MKQVIVIGLGNFGAYLASNLYEKGHEVIAIDKNPNRIQDIKDKATQAIVADASDRKILETIGITQADFVVICIGTSINDSILTTLNAKEIGAKYIIAKAISESHGRILEKIGASEIMFPERDTAVSLARRLDNPNMIEYLPFIEGYTILELAPSQKFLGKSLEEINLTNNYGVQIIAVKDIISDRLNIIPTGKYILKDSDLLILLGSQENLDKLQEND